MTLDEHKPKNDRRPSGNNRRPAEPVPAGRKALEQALSKAGMNLEDLVRPPSG
ncbi:hypothetical protein SAMN05421874_13043 [Nonomuraea maritima]|uniref:Uncharacterized protein n=1 Tax=Nonomuraea maritima TaxID=683260 RepID=A0A1G9NA72_9ACTN|nr:hypothetical protein [Nonomuraea maritima]SDL83416.1 hypothetical protein SAMN05421874_13043 [Nonomuraea maritima]